MACKEDRFSFMPQLFEKHTHIGYTFIVQAVHRFIQNQQLWVFHKRLSNTLSVLHAEVYKETRPLHIPMQTNPRKLIRLAAAMQKYRYHLDGVLSFEVGTNLPESLCRNIPAHYIIDAEIGQSANHFLELFSDQPWLQNF